MAYTVGSASVDIVPDFKNAQLAITRFFNSQPNEIKIPVTPTIDRDSVAKVEREAQHVGNGVGKAISDGASQSFNRNLVGTISREIEKLQNDIARAENNRRDATEALRLAELRRDEALKKGNLTDSRRLALDLAVDKAERRIAEANDLSVRSTASLSQARVRLAEATRQVAEETARAAEVAKRREEEAARQADEKSAARLAAEEAREESIRKKADEREVAQAIRTAERIAAQEEKIRREAEVIRARESERFAREEQVRLNRVYREAAREAARAARDSEKVRIQVEIDERQAREAGRKQGGLVARATKEEFHQNAGLIAAAVGATLVAGAPVALAAAGALFAGIGAVAVAQSEEIRQEWLGLWNDIKISAQSDANILIPTFERVAGRIGQSFQEMRPLIRDAFEAVGPQIETFTAALGDAANNALPGLVRAIQAGDPVVHGLGDLLESVGTGLSDFFDVLVAHAPAAGRTFSEVGSAVEALLPALAELLGQGTELASAVLPALTHSFEALNTVLQFIGPILPGIGAALLSFRLVRGVGNFLSNNIAIPLQKAAESGGLFAAAQGRVGSAIGKVAGALPILGAAVAGVAALSEEAARVTDGWRDALLAGGDAAGEATGQLLALENFWKNDSSVLAGVIRGFEPLADTIGLGEDAYEDATEAAHEYLQSLDPLTRAQVILKRETADLQRVLNDPDASGAQVAAAQQSWAQATERVRREQELLEQATRGVTEAMVAQGDAARALADSSFAYEDALNDVEDAQADYNDALANGTEEDQSRALLDLQKAYSGVAAAARDVALDALPATLDASQAAIIADEAQLKALNELHDKYGDLGPILENQRQELAAGVAAADGNALAQAHLAAALEQVGISTESIPGEKSVIISAPTEEVQKRLEDLGFTVEDIPGTTDVRVTANTAEAQNNIDKIDTELGDLDSRVAEPTAFLDGVPFFNVAKAVQNEVADIDSQKPQPAAFLNGVPFFGEAARILIMTATIDAQNPTPIADLVDRASSGLQGILGIVNSIDGRTATVTAIYRTIYETIGSVPLIGAAFGAAGGAAGGAIEGGLIQQNYDIGGAVVGRGGPLDDLIRASGPNPAIQYNIANGEHILDGRDVGLMGGQAGVYAFRDMLKAGRFGARFDGNDIRRMVENGATPSASPGGSQRPIHITTYDNPRAIVRAMKAQQQQEAALSAIW